MRPETGYLPKQSLGAIGFDDGIIMDYGNMNLPRNNHIAEGRFGARTLRAAEKTQIDLR